MRREFLSAAINAVDTLGDWLGLGSAACDALCERLCDRLDLIPSGVRERANLIVKES